MFGISFLFKPHQQERSHQLPEGDIWWHQIPCNDLMSGLHQQEQLPHVHVGSIDDAKDVFLP